MIVPVIWQSYVPGVDGRDQWDCGFIRRIFDRTLWTPTNGIEFEDVSGFDGIDNLPSTPEGAVVVLPAQHHLDHVDDLNRDLERLGWVILMLVGDEHHLFPWRQVKHDNMRLWVMTPHPVLHDDVRITPIIDGFKYDTPDILDDLYDPEFPERPFDWTFAGQVNSDRRKEWVSVLAGMDARNLDISAGFTQGLPRERFLKRLLDTKVAPCPGGIGMPSSFRAYEALEAGCIPLLDSKGGQPRILMDGNSFWHRLFLRRKSSVVINDLEGITELIPHFVNDEVFFALSARTSAHWQGYKREICYELDRQVLAFTGNDSDWIVPDDRITVLIPTSPIPSHPATAIIEETIESVRAQLPNAEILIMCDGVREEQEDRREDYDEYLYRLARLCEHRWHNVLPIIQRSWQHQANLTRLTLPLVETDLVLFVEHDTPIYGDIPWGDMIDVLDEQLTDVIRLMHESAIHPEHAHLMYDQAPVVLNRLPVVRTTQWSQRPHLAKHWFYTELLDRYFTWQSKTMIEDRIHGAAQDDPEGIRIAIYHPEGDIKRSWHTDGRGDDPKYEMMF